MNNRRLIVCDRDRDYATALCDYIRANESGLEVVMYTDPHAFCADIKEVGASVLLIQESFLKEADTLFGDDGWIREADMGRWFILTEDRTDQDVSDNSVYKYQSAGNIIGLIGEDLSHRHRIVREAQYTGGISLIGVYSPVNHTLKTTFAMTLGQILAEKGQVLYINLEGYSGLFEMLDIRSEVSLLDLMYEYSLHSEDLGNILSKYSVRVDELNVLIPARSPFELQEVEPSLWMSFLSDLTGLGRYGAVILDISDTIRGALDLMNVCTQVYTPLRKDRFSVAKLKDFTDMLAKCPGADELNARMVKIRFPYFDDVDGSLADLKNSRLARYIRNEICKERVNEQG